MKKLSRSISDSKIMTAENKDQVCRLQRVIEAMVVPQLARRLINRLIPG